MSFNKTLKLCCWLFLSLRSVNCVITYLYHHHHWHFNHDVIIWFVPVREQRRVWLNRPIRERQTLLQWLHRNRRFEGGADGLGWLIVLLALLVLRCCSQLLLPSAQTLFQRLPPLWTVWGEWLPSPQFYIHSLQVSLPECQTSLKGSCGRPCALFPTASSP